MPVVPNIRVVVRLPWSRDENPLPDPPTIEWNSEKADILWKVIERSRTSDNGGTDWKGLAAHLEVPLPYLLYRVHTRFQEEIRGLQDIPGILSPVGSQPSSATKSDDVANPEIPSVARRRLSASTRFPPRMSTPVGIRARLNSLGNNVPRPRKATSSSTLTVQGPHKVPEHSLRPTTPSSAGSDSDEDLDIKEEEADKNAEEEENLDRKLRQLQQMINSEAIGLVSLGRRKGKGKGVERGRIPLGIRSELSRSRRDNLSRSQSISSTGSPQGSIPDIPSPATDSLPQSPHSRHLSPSKSASPPTVSPRSAVGQRYSHIVRTNTSDSTGSNHDSEASSFSDISDASLSASALESALMSNIRGNGSRFSQFTRGRFGGSRAT